MDGFKDTKNVDPDDAKADDDITSPNTSTEDSSLPVPQQTTPKIAGDWVEGDGDESVKVNVHEALSEQQQSGGQQGFEVIDLETAATDAPLVVSATASGLSQLQVMQSLLDPPPTCSERFRDEILRILDEGFFQVLGIIVLFLVVLDGAVFFFFLMGWQTLCRPRTACEPRNTIYNVSVQIWNGLFTYMATVSMPWRCANFLHSTGWHLPRRKNEPGYDLYGLPTRDIWFHVPRRKRIHVLFFLIWNCLFQYVNQGMRIVYWSYELQSEFPGNLMVNVFFGSSFIAAGIGGILMIIYTGQTRRENPGKFDPGPKELLHAWWKTYIRRETDDTDKNDDDNAEGRPDVEEAYNHPDPTRASHGWEATRLDRAEMRLWAM